MRPCSNTLDNRPPPYCFRLFVSVQHGSYFCLSKLVQLRSITSARTRCHALCRGRGPTLLPLVRGQPAWPPLSGLLEDPKAGPSRALGLCVRARRLQAVTCVTRERTQAAHANHADDADVETRGWWLMTFFPFLMHAHKALCLVKTCSEGRVGNCLLIAHFLASI